MPRSGNLQKPMTVERGSGPGCMAAGRGKWGLLAVTLIGIGVMLWARIDDRRKGLR